MLQQDTLYITDSASCKYIIVDKYVSQNDTVLPLNSLWSAKTLTTTLPLNNTRQDAININGNKVLSSLTLAFFILLVLFSREIINVFPNILRSLFKLKNHFRLEEKLALSKQRDVVTIVAALYFPVLTTLMTTQYVVDRYHIQPLHYLFFSLLFIFGFWLLRKTLYSILSWVTNDKVTFKLIEKIGYNHLIISVIFSFPAILYCFIWTEVSDQTTINILVFCCLFVYLFYLLRVYQIIISHRYSHFFYILYLCSIELLPVAILANLILSY